MRKNKRIILLLILTSIFLLCIIISLDNKNNRINHEIVEKEALIERNDSKINTLTLEIEDASNKSEYLKKEYKVWVHQLEKLENILP